MSSFLRHVRKNFQLINSYNTTMASSLTFSASVGQQQKVFSVKKNASSKKRVSVQTKAASFVRFCYVMFSLFYVCIIFLIFLIFFTSSSYPLIFLICRLVSLQTGRSVQSERMRGTRSRGRQRRLNRRFIRRQFYGLRAERCRHGCVQFARRESARRYLEISLHQRENHVQTRDELPFNHDFGREQNRHRFQDV